MTPMRIGWSGAARPVFTNGNEAARAAPTAGCRRNRRRERSADPESAARGAKLVFFMVAPNCEIRGPHGHVCPRSPSLTLHPGRINAVGWDDPPRDRPARDVKSLVAKPR